MSLFASFNGGGNPVLGLILLPFFLGLPFAMVWLVARAFLKPDPQSLLLLGLLVIMEGFACYFVFTMGFNEFSRNTTFWKGWTIALMLGFATCPFALGWETYKQGWLNRWIYPKKKKRKKNDRVLPS